MKFAYPPKWSLYTGPPPNPVNKWRHSIHHIHNNLTRLLSHFTSTSSSSIPSLLHFESLHIALEQFQVLFFVHPQPLDRLGLVLLKQHVRLPIEFNLHFGEQFFLELIRLVLVHDDQRVLGLCESVGHELLASYQKQGAGQLHFVPLTCGQVQFVHHHVSDRAEYLGEGGELALEHPKVDCLYLIVVLPRGASVLFNLFIHYENLLVDWNINCWGS